MALFKRGKFYWYEFWFEGRRYRKSTGVANQRDAGEIERSFRTALAKADVGITERKPAPNFRAAMADFLKWSSGAQKQSTHRRYKTSSIALLSHFRDTTMDRISSDDVERFKTTRAREYKTVRGKEKRVPTKKRVRPATVNRELACLKALFNFVIRADLLAKNPVSKVKMLAENNLQTRVLSFKEQHAYLAKATPTLRDIAVMMLETGMRPEEVYRLRPEHVDLAKCKVQVTHGKTDAARRSLRLTSAAGDVLKARTSTEKGPFLFPCDADKKRPIPKINNAHDRAVRDSKVPAFRLYDLRHTWATRAAQSGIDLVTLAAVLGHSKINLVLRYAHPTQDHQTQAMERLEKYNAHQQIAEFEQFQTSAQ